MDEFFDYWHLSQIKVISVYPRLLVWDWKLDPVLYF